MTDRHPANPNYAARRMLVSAGVITAVVVAASVVWQSVRDEDRAGQAAEVTWDAVALVATTSGDVTLVDAAGAIVARHPGSGRVTDVHVAGSRLALVQFDAVTLLDLAANEPSAPLSIELDPQARAISRLGTTRDRILLAAGSRNGGGTIRVIDGDSGTTHDIAELGGLTDPLLFTGTLRVDPLGSAVAVADARTGQTIVLRGLDGTDEPSIENYADQPLALSDRVVATSQVVGGRADVSVHASGLLSAAPVATGIPAGAAIIDGALVAVTTDGSVFAVRVGDRQVRQLSTLELPDGATVTGVHLAANGTRLVVYAANSYVAVLDTDGKVLATAELDTQAESLPPAWEWICLPVALGTNAARVIALDDGTDLTSLRNVTVTGTSADGCTVLGTRGTATVAVSERGTANLGRTQEATLSPDGRLVVRRLDDGTTALVPLDGDMQPGTPVDISAAAPSAAVSVAFVDR
jgi:hypothetical protein